MAIARKVQENLGKSSWIRRMFEEGEKMRREIGADRVFDFTLGNPDGEPPKEFQEGLRQTVENPQSGMHRYMPNAGYPDVRQAVANYLIRETGLPVTAGHVVMTVGAGGGLNVILKTILDPGDEVITIAPFFVEYGFYVDNHGGTLVPVMSDREFQPDWSGMEAAINERTKALIINSPNNPTGVVYSQDTLVRLGELLTKKEQELGTEIYLISDEPYSKLVYDGVRVPAVFQFVARSMVVTSHSKDLALPGERIGYVAINPQITEAGILFDGLVFANRVLGFVNAPALMQRLVAPLQGLVVGVDSYRERRDLLYNHLISIGFRCVKPEGAFYLFPESPMADDVEFSRVAAKHGILVVPGTGFGAPGYFRLAYCIAEETIRRSLPAFTALAAELQLHVV